MKSKGEGYRDNAHNCAELAANAKDEPSRKRFKRMEAAWLELAEQQDWLDGKAPSKKRPSSAADMAGDEIDRVDDKAATSDERASRKRQLVKGPSELREMRVDQPKKR